ncbi:hypothetical protein, partial [Georgenia ruanii]
MFDDEQDDSPTGGDGSVPDGAPDTPGRLGAPASDAVGDDADAVDHDDVPGAAGDAEHRIDAASAADGPAGLAGVLQAVSALVGLPLAAGLA